MEHALLIASSGSVVSAPSRALTAAGGSGTRTFLSRFAHVTP
jgi:hypothetical protein